MATEDDERATDELVTRVRAILAAHDRGDLITEEDLARLRELHALIERDRPRLRRALARERAAGPTRPRRRRKPAE